jgi:large subunit ribosomal protein L28
VDNREKVWKTSAFVFFYPNSRCFLNFIALSLVSISKNYRTKNMSRRDDITGRKAMNGYRSSKANNKTKHRFHLNLQKRSFYLPEEDRWVTLKVSAKTLRTINKKGISAVLKDARRRGTLLKKV